MKINQQVYNRIVTTVKEIPPESGGILGEKNGVIEFVEYDSGIPQGRMCSYSPNVQRLNYVIAEWEQQGITFCGMFHTHYFGVETLSEGDISYIKKIMSSMPKDITKLYFPLVVLPQREMIVYTARRNVEQNDVWKEVTILKEELEYE